MKAVVVGILTAILGLWTGMVLDDLGGEADVSSASLLPGTITRDAEPIIVTRTLGRVTAVRTAQAAAETRTERVTVTAPPETTTVTETTTTTATTTEKQKGRDRE